ncbi:MAG: hypothetical protein IPJ65_22150 [Archangiaceae bacterium]|nr:hypothetical protein [Archangiaceae bacterium]
MPNVNRSSPTITLPANLSPEEAQQFLQEAAARGQAVVVPSNYQTGFDTGSSPYGNPTHSTRSRARATRRRKTRSRTTRR